MVAMKDPESGDLIFDPKALKIASIKYCVNLLQNTDIDPDYEDEIYVENLVHYLRCKEENEEDDELIYSDFLKRIKTISVKHADKYKFILKAGQGFRNFLNKFGTQNTNQNNGATQSLFNCSNKGGISVIIITRDLYILKNQWQNYLKE